MTFSGDKERPAWTKCSRVSEPPKVSPVAELSSTLIALTQWHTDSIHIQSKIFKPFGLSRRSWHPLKPCSCSSCRHRIAQYFKQISFFVMIEFCLQHIPYGDGLIWQSSRRPPGMAFSVYRQLCREGLRDVFRRVEAGTIDAQRSSLCRELHLRKCENVVYAMVINEMTYLHSTMIPPRYPGYEIFGACLV